MKLLSFNPCFFYSLRIPRGQTKISLINLVLVGRVLAFQNKIPAGRMNAKAICTLVEKKIKFIIKNKIIFLNSQFTKDQTKVLFVDPIDI